MGFSGYREIQEPRRKCALIAYERLRELAGSPKYDQLQASHRGWWDESLGDGVGSRDNVIRSGLAAYRPVPLNAVSDLAEVGSEEFVERTKVELGIRAKGRKVPESGEAYQLREPQVSYPDVFGTKNADIGAENSYSWNTNPYISV